MSYRKSLLSLFVLIIACVALYFLYRAIDRYGIDRVVEALASLPTASLAAAMGFAVASYLCLAGFDYLGVRYVGKPLPYHKTALASFVALSIGHNVGVSGLSSGAIRYHYYSRWGLSVADVARMIVFSGVTVAIGLSEIIGLGILFYPSDTESFVGLQRSTAVLLACACVAWPWAYVVASVFVRGKIRIWRWHLFFPRPVLALWQIALGTVNFALVAACLHQLVNGLAETPYTKVVAVFALGQSAGLLSHVPGGLGVLEATVLYLLPGATSLAALIAFRVVYFFVPLLAGIALFVVTGAYQGVKLHQQTKSRTP